MAAGDALGKFTTVLNKVLTTAYTGSTATLDTKSAQFAYLYCTCTKGSLTSTQIKVETSPDGGTTFQNMGNAVNPLVEFSTTTDGDTVRFKVGPLAGFDTKLKVSAKGTGTVTGSNIKVEARFDAVRTPVAL